MKKSRSRNQSLGVDAWVRFAQGRPDCGWRSSDNTFELPTEGAVIVFATHLATAKGCSPTVIRRRLRGMGQWFKERLGSDPRFDGYGVMRPQLNTVLRGISIQRSTRKRQRDPITAEKLRDFTAKLGALRLDPTDEAMAKAAMWLGMMGLLRAGEITTKTEADFDPTINANRQDVKLHRHQSGQLSHLTLFLRQSKCDQTGRGVEVTVYASGSDMCAVQFMDNYLRMTSGRAANGPLFAFQTSRVKPLTRSKLNKYLQVLAKACGHNPRHTTTHSLRQGGAVTLFSLGYSADYIKKAGRWLSGAYEVYLSIPEAQKAEMAQRMATAGSGTDNDGVASLATWTELYRSLVTA